MRRAWALLILGALLAAPSVRADPALSSPSAGQGLATWSFSNAANYSTQDATLSTAGAALAWFASSFTDSSLSDFSSASSALNVDLLSNPGDVCIMNTSQPGPVQSLTFQPGPAGLADNYLYKGSGGSPNFGTSAELKAGNWGGGEWTRAVLQFPTLPLPWNATLVAATLDLYFYDPVTTAPIDFSAHRMTTPWTELGSNWDTSDGATPWNTTGGDFDPAALDTVAGVGTVAGWYSWNVTSLAAAWWRGAVPNQGLMIRQVADDTTILGEKGFYSSDSGNASARPRLRMEYTTPSSRGILVSRAFDAVGVAAWGTVWWNATAPLGTAVAVRTRSGNTFPADASWSPWSAAYAGSGSMIASPPARYLEYELDLFTPSPLTPSVHDVSVAYGRFAVAGHVTTQPFAPPGLAGWGQLRIDATTPAGTTVSIETSQDNGSSWIPATDGQDLASALPGAILLRIDLMTTNTTKSPAVAGVSLAYRLDTGGLGGPSPAGVPWWVFLVAAVGLGLWLVYRWRSTRPYRPEALYLIHSNGKLVARAGLGEGMQDELAASAMLTLVLRFVKDSFRGPGGTGGELRSFKVDEDEVVIAQGKFLLLALRGPGVPPATLAERMNEFVAWLEAAYGGRLRAWDGLREGLEGLDADLGWFLEKGHRQSHTEPGGRSHA